MNERERERAPRGGAPHAGTRRGTWLKFPAWLAAALLAVLLAGSARWSPPAPPLGLQIKAPRAQLDLTLSGQLPPSPESAMVYQVVYPQVDEGYVARLAAAFGLDPASSRQGETVVLARGAQSLEVYPQTGAFWYKDAERLWQPDGRAPAEEAGIALAEAFLAARGLLPGDALFEGTGHSQLTVYDAATGSSTVRDTDLHVNYRLCINGAPVEGPGGKIKVYLGEGNRVVGLYWAAFEIAPARAQPIISPQQALEHLRQDGIATTVKDPRSATVSQVSLAYLAGPGNEAQEFLEPVYRVSGVVAGEAEEERFVQYVPALVGQYRSPIREPAAPER